MTYVTPYQILYEISQDIKHRTKPFEANASKNASLTMCFRNAFLIKVFWYFQQRSM